jgi:hypothetical protein
MNENDEDLMNYSATKIENCIKTKKYAYVHGELNKIKTNQPNKKQKILEIHPFIQIQPWEIQPWEY